MSEKGTDFKEGDEVFVTTGGEDKLGDIVEYIPMVDLYLVRYKESNIFQESTGMHRASFIRKVGDWSFKAPKCDCGFEAVNATGHTDYCSKKELIRS